MLLASSVLRQPNTFGNDLGELAFLLSGNNVLTTICVMLTSGLGSGSSGAQEAVEVREIRREAVRETRPNIGLGTPSRSNANKMLL